MRDTTRLLNLQSRLRLPSTAPKVVSSSTFETTAARATNQTSRNSSSATTSAINKDDERRRHDDSAPPKLVEVPSFPFVGSMISQLSGTPVFDSSRIYDYFPELRRRFGDFYKMGFPGIGVGSHGTAYFINDPKQMMKVVRAEGKYPSGVIERLWPLRDFFTDEGFAVKELFGRGEEWKRLRTFLQADMLSPESARGYVPAIIKAAEHASRGAPSHRDDLNRYLHHCAFDMFNAVMFGELSKVADSETPSDPEIEAFCEAVTTALSLTNVLLLSLYETMMHNIGIETAKYKKFKSSWQSGIETAEVKVQSFIERKRKGDLNQDELSSYLSRAVDRHAGQSSSITKKEMMELCMISLAAGVDTTSGLMSWNLLHIAQNPEVQEKLYDELSSFVTSSSASGKLTVDVLDRSNSPYLHAIFRETIRMTPPFIVPTQKIISSDIDIHGILLPQGSLVVFDLYSAGNDSDLVDDPDQFRPERWLPDAAAARKGTKAEMLDHLLFASPFSQGARRCPGSRVATNEVHILLAQLVLDWKISSPVKKWRDVPCGFQSVFCPKLPQLEFVPH